MSRKQPLANITASLVGAFQRFKAEHGGKKVPRKHMLKRRYSRSNNLVLPGPAVRGFVKKVLKRPISKSEPLTVQEIKKIGAAIMRIPKYVISDEETMGRVYANRSAEQVLKDNAIFVGEKGTKFNGILGCVDRTHVAIACLAACGVPARFLRMGNHALTKFPIGRKFFVLNITDTTIQVVTYLPKTLISEASTFLEGRDAHDIGLDIDTFFNPRSLEAGVDRPAF